MLRIFWLLFTWLVFQICLTHNYLMLMGLSFVHVQPRTTTKQIISQRFWSIWFGACKSALQQLRYLVLYIGRLSMLHIYHPYFSNSSLKMRKLIIGKSYVLTLTRMRRGWKIFLQVSHYPNPIVSVCPFCCKAYLFCKRLYILLYKWLGWNSDDFFVFTWTLKNTPWSIFWWEVCWTTLVV